MTVPKDGQALSGSCCSGRRLRSGSGSELVCRSGFQPWCSLRWWCLQEHPEFVEAGVMGAGVFEDVVHVDEVGAVTALDLAADAPELEGGALMGGGPALEVGDVLHVDAVLDHDRQRGVAQQVSNRRHRYGADAADLTGLAVFDLAAPQRLRRRPPR